MQGAAKSGDGDAAGDAAMAGRRDVVVGLRILAGLGVDQQTRATAARST